MPNTSKAPKSETPATGREGDSVPLVDDKDRNTPDGKPKAPGAEGNAKGYPAGKQPGGAR